MARRSAKLDKVIATPTLEVFKGVQHSTVIVGTSVLALPAANLSYRKGMIIQNKHDTNIVYLGGGLPDIIEGSRSETEGVSKSIQWVLSANGTNEWYASSTSGGDPSLTQTKILYYKVAGGTETLATEGTVSSIAAEHGWGWGDGDTLGWNTLYIRTDGATVSSRPEAHYKAMLSYTFTLTADDATTGGLELGPRDNLPWTFDGSGRVFAIASGASTPVCCFEVL